MAATLFVLHLTFTHLTSRLSHFVSVTFSPPITYVDPLRFLT